ncbi:hypothetical protein OV203_02495 [Nannocystis sp. ILAH1]|uniref:hypothetical protein n=1 Tax=Nannocystis sp. ILAH1 TaxID=2996789 RepID=UPI00226F16BA|nr:hypothetical protein [Nannocystis sp. ILAH1]MCY0985981.1 hypothetical protein [Nannocystis sp. ILAH1]
MRRTGELFHFWPEWDLNEDHRKGAALRLELYQGGYKPRVQSICGKRIRDQATAKEVARCVTTAHGLAGAVTDACCVAYQGGAQRELRGADAATARAFADLVVECGIAEDAGSLNALSWISGPVVVAPFVSQVRGEPRLCLSTMTQDTCAVRRHPSAPEVIEAVLHQRDDGIFAELSAWGWKYYDEKGHPLGGGAYDTAHGLGYCPAVGLRSRPRLAFGWDGALDHVGLADAALEVSFRMALGMWVRQQNLADLVIITAPIKNVAKRQALGHPTRPLYFNADPNQVRVDVKPRSTSVVDYLAEIAALSGAAVSRYGIPPSAVSFANDNSNWGTLSIAMTPGALAAQRKKQVPLLRRAEIELWPMVADVVRMSAHRHARRLPPRATFAEMLRVQFPDLAEPDEQLKNLEAFGAAQKHGVANVVDLLMKLRPELSRAEAEEEVAANYEDYAARLDWLTRHNVTLDPQRGVQGISQINGRAGGQRSGEVRREESDQ